MDSCDIVEGMGTDRSLIMPRMVICGKSLNYTYAHVGEQNALALQNAVADQFHQNSVDEVLITVCCRLVPVETVQLAAIAEQLR